MPTLISLRHTIVENSGEKDLAPATGPNQRNRWILLRNCAEKHGLACHLIVVSEVFNGIGPVNHRCVVYRRGSRRSAGNWSMGKLVHSWLGHSDEG